MTSLRQLEANRCNALKSTGPKSELGKQHSRCNAMRHGLTAETVIQFKFHDDFVRFGDDIRAFRHLKYLPHRRTITNHVARLKIPIVRLVPQRRSFPAFSVQCRCASIARLMSLITIISRIKTEPNSSIAGCR